MLGLLAAALAAAVPNGIGAGSEAAPPTDSQVETFLSVLPDRASAGAVSEPDPEMMARLNALNPGKAAEVKGILEAFESCLAPAVAEGTMRMLNRVARSLDEADLQRMTEFFRNEPASTMALIERLKGPSPSAADRAAGKKLLAAYPIAEFSDAFRRATAEIPNDRVFSRSALKCKEARLAALARAGLKSD